MENKEGRVQLFGSEVNLIKESSEQPIEKVGDQVSPSQKVEEIEPPKEEVVQVEKSTTKTTEAEVQEPVPQNTSLSDAAKLAIDYKSKGIIPEDIEIPNNLTPEQMSDMIKENIYHAVHQRAQEDVVQQLKDLGYDKNTLKRARLLALGASDEEIIEIGKYRQAAAYKPSSSEEMEYFVKNYFIHKGMEEDRAKRLVSGASNEELKQDFEEGVRFFEKQADSLEEKLKESKRQAAAERERYEKELDDSYIRVIDSRKIGRVNISESEAKQLKSSIFDKTEAIQMPDGSSGFVTKYEKALKELDKNPEGQMWVARAILNKSWDMEEVNREETKRSILEDLGAEVQKASNTGDVESKDDGRVLLFG